MLLVILLGFAEQWRDLWGNGFTKQKIANSLRRLKNDVRDRTTLVTSHIVLCAGGETCVLLFDLSALQPRRSQLSGTPFV